MRQIRKMNLQQSIAAHLPVDDDERQSWVESHRKEIKAKSPDLNSQEIDAMIAARYPNLADLVS